MEPIEIYLIGGFLGAGKTTLLLSLLEHWVQRRLGVIVNEFGAISVDGTVIQQDGIQLVEINHGSIFCSCLKDGFVRTLKAFNQQPIDTLLIENSGLADPAGMSRLLQGLAPYLQRPFVYRGLICLVDATNFLDYAEVLLPLESQVREASLLVVNKTDQAQPTEIAEIHTLLAQWNPQAPVYDTVYARLPWPLPTGCAPVNQENQAEPHSNATPAHRPTSLLLQTLDQPKPAQLHAFCLELAEATLRIKGFTRHGSGWLHTDAVRKQAEIAPAAPGQSPQNNLGKLVLIGRDGADIQARVREAWLNHCGPDCRLTVE